VLPFLYGPPPRFAVDELDRAEKLEQQSAVKPDGSINAPFFIRSPKTAKEVQQEARERSEKSFSDWLLTAFTGAVALFTLALVFATIKLYKAGRDQLASIRAESISSHRPQLIVRAAFHNLPVNFGISISIFVVIANVGETAATIVESNIGFDLVATPRYVFAPRSTGVNELGVTEPIQPGESRQFTVTSTTRNWNAASVAHYQTDDLGLFLTGHIVYADEMGVRRQLAFWRRYDPATYRFARIKAPAAEYEYTD
jgi:hypothetical protein